MTPTIDQIRDAIVAKIAGLANPGQVHAYERYAKRLADFKALFLSQGQIRGWTLRRIATAESSPAIGRAVITHRWEIRAYMSLDDSAASERAFDALVEAARDAFRADETLGGLVAGTAADGVTGLQVIDAGPVMFADILCHSARLRLATVHIQ